VWRRRGSDGVPGRGLPIAKSCLGGQLVVAVHRPVLEEVLPEPRLLRTPARCRDLHDRPALEFGCRAAHQLRRRLVHGDEAPLLVRHEERLAVSGTGRLADRSRSWRSPAMTVLSEAAEGVVHRGPPAHRWRWHPGERDRLRPGGLFPVPARHDHLRLGARQAVAGSYSPRKGTRLRTTQHVQIDDGQVPFLGANRWQEAGRGRHPTARRSGRGGVRTPGSRSARGGSRSARS